MSNLYKKRWKINKSENRQYLLRKRNRLQQSVSKWRIGTRSCHTSGIHSLRVGSQLAAIQAVRALGMGGWAAVFCCVHISHQSGTEWSTLGLCLWFRTEHIVALYLLFPFLTTCQICQHLPSHTLWRDQRQSFQWTCSHASTALLQCHCHRRSGFTVCGQR